MKKVLIVVIVLILAAGGYLFFGNKSLKKNNSSTKEISESGFEIMGENGNPLSAEYVDAMKQDYSVAIYPNSSASQESQSAGNFNFNGQQALIGSFKTPDSVEKVISFYERQMGSDALTGNIESNGINYKVVKNKNNTGPVIGIYTSDNKTIYTIIKPVTD